MRDHRIVGVSEANSEKDFVGLMRNSDNMSNLSGRDIYA